MPSRPTLLALALLASCASRATLKPDYLVCDGRPPLAHAAQNSRAVTGFSASEVLRRTQIALDALEQVDLSQASDETRRKHEVAVLKANLTLTHCFSSGASAVPVKVLERFRVETEMARISLLRAGVPVVGFTEAEALID